MLRRRLHQQPRKVAIAVGVGSTISACLGCSDGAQSITPTVAASTQVEVRSASGACDGAPVAVSWVVGDEIESLGRHVADSSLTHAIVSRAVLTRSGEVVAVSSLPSARPLVILGFVGSEIIPAEMAWDMAPCTGRVHLGATTGRTELVLEESSERPRAVETDAVEACLDGGGLPLVVDVGDSRRRVTCRRAGVRGDQIAVELQVSGWVSDPRWSRLEIFDDYGDMARVAGPQVARALRGSGFDGSQIAVLAEGSGAPAAVDVLRETGARRVVLRYPRFLDPREDLRAFGGGMPPEPARRELAEFALSLGASEVWADWSRLVGEPLPFSVAGLDTEVWGRWVEASPMTWLEGHAAELVIGVLEDTIGLGERLRRHGATVIEMTSVEKAEDIFNVPLPVVPDAGRHAVDSVGVDGP